MLHFPSKIAALSLVALFILSPVASATVVLPALEIDNFAGDAGVSSDGTTLTIDATVFSILVDDTPITSINIADLPFTLTATYSGLAGGSTYTFINGSLSAGSYLTATFSTLSMTGFAGTNGVFSADLTYTGGSLIGGLTSGTLEGGFDNATSLDFSSAFTATNLTGAKVGAVVPVPAAVWLFGSGLLGLVGIARRKAT